MLHLKKTILLFIFMSIMASTVYSQVEVIVDSTSIISETDSLTQASGALDVNIANKDIILNDAGEQIYPMSAERKNKLIAYSFFNNIWRFFEFIIGIGVLFLILFTGFSAKLRNWSLKIKYKFFSVWFFLALFLVTDYILNFPFNLYRNFLVEGEYGFLNQTFIEWFKEDLLGLMLGILIGIIPAWFFYWLICRVKRWWLWFSIGAIPFVIFFIVIAPVIISPLFNKYEPLKDKQLETSILNLASKAGIEGSDVFQVDASKQSSKINAYVTGLFGSKRIVLYDNMINNFSEDEIKFVMGHEMGHYVMHHMWLGLAIFIVFIALALWITDRTLPAIIRRYKNKFKFDRLGDVASLPLVLIYLSIISFLFNPVISSWGRYIEHKSDIYGMDISCVTGDVAATAFDKLSVFNLSDPDPHPFIEFWFYDHPALKKRMDFVRNYYLEKQNPKKEADVAT